LKYEIGGFVETNLETRSWSWSRRPTGFRTRISPSHL